MATATLSQIRAFLSITAERWSALAGRLPEELLARQPAPGEWSALECLQHLVDTERWVFPVRMQALLDGRDFEAFDPDAQGSKEASGTPAELAAQLASLRSESLAALERVVEGDLGRSARHMELGPVTLSELLHEWVGHDLMHTMQAERALMQPFIDECGPWLPYFAGHKISG